MHSFVFIRKYLLVRKWVYIRTCKGLSKQAAHKYFCKFIGGTKKIKNSQVQVILVLFILIWFFSFFLFLAIHSSSDLYDFFKFFYNFAITARGCLNNMCVNKTKIYTNYTHINSVKIKLYTYIHMYLKLSVNIQLYVMFCKYFYMYKNWTMLPSVKK